MKITQNYPLNFFAKITYEIKDGKVFRYYKNLQSECIFEFDISDIKRSYFYKTGDESWWNLAVILLFINIVFGWVWQYFKLSWSIRFEFDIIFLIAFILCIATSFVKRKWVGFQNIYGQHIFAIQLTNKPGVEEFVGELNMIIKNNNKY